MIAYLGSFIQFMNLNIGEFFVVPFWFFELFVALIQAVVFFVLSSMYFRAAIEDHH